MNLHCSGILTIPERTLEHARDTTAPGRKTPKTTFLPVQKVTVHAEKMVVIRKVRHLKAFNNCASLLV